MNSPLLGFSTTECAARLGVLLAVAMLLFAPSALAEAPLPEGVSVEWSAPPECPGPTAVRSSIAALLREDQSQGLAKPTGGPLSFRAAVTVTGGRYLLDVDVRSPTGDETKSLDGANCSVVSDAFALVAAFAIDPNLVGHEPPALSSSPAANPLRDPREPPRTPAPSAPVQPDIADPAPLPWGFGLLAATSVGALPFANVGLGGLVTVGARPRWELGGWYWFSRRASLVGTPGAVDATLLSGRASACILLATRASIELCPALEVGKMAGAGQDVDHHDSGQAWWIAPSVGVAARVPLYGALGARIRLDVGVPLFRPNFVIQRASGAFEGVWRPALVFGILSVTPEIDFSPRMAKPPAM